MSKIKVLPEYIFNKIAAGEVIERPASVVKELVENSIDAGALNIIINIEKAGAKLISISDNGSGMDADDALLCLEPHATSKIATEKDIEKILTLGFRGEALPSIASISRFIIRTRRPSDREGTEVIVHGGKFISTAPAGCAPGTEIIVKDIFFNTPARKKFLRGQTTEEHHIQETLMMLSLPYPHVGFELNMDGYRVFSSPAHSDLRPRIKTFFGKDMEENFIPVSYSAEGLKVSGYTAKHGYTRNTRREQRIFVNGRPVEALPAYAGIREAYGSLVEKGRFPPALLFINIDPAMIDVNVHPAKREIRFSNDRAVIAVITEAVRASLRTHSSPTVTFRPDVSVRAILGGMETKYTPAGETPSLPLPDGNPDYQTPMEIYGEKAPVPSDGTEEYHQSSPEIIPVPEPPFAGNAPVNDRHMNNSFPATGSMKVLGFIDKTYIVASSDAGLIIIDQHAAHERVLYEKIMKGVSLNAVNSQKLLIPLTIELSRTETLFVRQNSELFARIGFDIEPFGQNTVLLTAIPSAIKQENLQGLFRNILDSLLDRGEISKIDVDLIARTACKAAIKAQDEILEEEAVELIRQMAECELPFSCPHGRPTIINISRSELEKRFGRK